jgi:aminoglycoside phosphotransferase family enzyme/predicted kinase
VAVALLDGSLLGCNADAVLKFETHISLVAVAGELVYKLKKPVTMPFLDYGDRSRRRTMCLREVELNRRLASDLYVGVQGIRRVTGSFELCQADEPEAVEHVVVMRYVDRMHMLDRWVDTATVTHEQIAAVGRRLGAFHREAPRVEPPAGEAATVRAWALRRIEAVKAGAGRALDEGRVLAACDFLERWLERNADRLAKRVEQGFIRDGHGDLRLEHVVVGSPVRVLDCVEFDGALRANDVLSDLAFLVMELQQAEREDLTRVLLEAWTRAGETVDGELLWMYAAARALVRVEVALERLGQLAPGFEHEVVEEQAATLLHLAIRLSWRARTPRAIIFAGLSGSGKTTLSRRLADRWGLERVSSDEVRKRLIGLGRDQLAPPHAYEDNVSKDVYERLGREAGREVAASRCIVVDATFRRPLDAQAFVRAYRGAGGMNTSITFTCVADDETLHERVKSREQLGGADAGLDVLKAQLETQSSAQIGISNAIQLDTGDSIERVLVRAERQVLEATVP